MNIVFMGTPDFSVPALRALIDAGHHVQAVITQPDKPKGRGKEVQFTPVKQAAMEYNIPVYQPWKIKDEEFVGKLRLLNPEVIVVIAFGQILSGDILSIPKFGCINIHASLLPKYRGAAPIQWAVINGEKVSGVTTMYMDEGLDTGDMLDRIEILLDEKETGGSLHDKLSQAGAKLILETLEKIKNGTITKVPQDDLESSYAGMMDKQLGSIDFSMKAVEIERLIRGLNPWPSAYTNLNDKILKIWDADILDKNFNGESGEIEEVSDKGIIVKTGENALVIKNLQLEGKKRMDVADFLRGYSLNPGQKLG